MYKVRNQGKSADPVKRWVWKLSFTQFDRRNKDVKGFGVEDKQDKTVEKMSVNIKKFQVWENDLRRINQLIKRQLNIYHAYGKVFQWRHVVWVHLTGGKNHRTQRFHENADCPHVFEGKRVLLCLT